MITDQIEILAQNIWDACRREGIAVDLRQWTGADGDWVDDPRNPGFKRMIIVVDEKEKQRWRRVAKRLLEAAA